jgi:hypothetical protein
MSTDNLKLLLTELEVEVVEEALELYLRARSVPVDRRFEYRYRAAHAVLDSLRPRDRSPGTFPTGDDDDRAHRDDEVPERRSRPGHAED